MAFPDRTYDLIYLQGAADATKVLKSPVDGGIDGADADGSEYLIGFVATEDTGVGYVETTS